MKKPLLLAAGFFASTLAIAPSAHAFREAATFAEPVEIGGGGERQFTGSIHDGFTCAVCHRGRDPNPVEITGLPLEGYVPGGTYEIEILMPNSPVSSLGLELTDEIGQGVGSLSLPATPEGPDLCDTPERAGQNAASRITLPESRVVIAMDGCGAERLRAVWTAPADPVGAVWFHTAVVAGDDNADTLGDGVEEIARVIPVSGSSAEAARVGSSCDASGSPRDAAPWGALIFVAVSRRASRRR